jgi:hypothetical protein
MSDRAAIKAICEAHLAPRPLITRIYDAKTGDCLDSSPNGFTWDRIVEVISMHVPGYGSAYGEDDICIIQTDDDYEAGIEQIAIRGEVVAFKRLVQRSVAVRS